MNRTERLLDLITYLLNAREPVSWQSIKNHFPEDYAKGVEESNQRKFERDKAELISLGIPIDYQTASEGQKEGYLIRKEKFFLPEIQFSPEELSLLMLAAGAVREAENFPYREQLDSALDKIVSLHDQVNPAPENIKITYPGGEAKGAQGAMLAQIQEALDRRKCVEIRYYAFSTGEITFRKVNPYGLIFRRGKWTLVGFDHLRSGLRTFVLNRIEKLKVNQRRPGTPDYEIPSSFSLRHYQSLQPWELEFHAPVEVTLHVSPHRTPELLPQLSKAIALGEGCYRLRVTNEAGLVSWALSQKTDVQILDPLDLQRKVIEVLGRIQ